MSMLSLAWHERRAKVVKGWRMPISTWVLRAFFHLWAEECRLALMNFPTLLPIRWADCWVMKQTWIPNACIQKAVWLRLISSRDLSWGHFLTMTWWSRKVQDRLRILSTSFSSSNMKATRLGWRVLEITFFFGVPSFEDSAFKGTHIDVFA